MNFANASLTALRAALDAKQVSAVELAEYFLARAERALALNTFLHVDRGLTLVQAREADARIARGAAVALTGIPVAHKDIFVTKDWRSTAGSNMLADYVSPFDATVVEKLHRDAGMVRHAARLRPSRFSSSSTCSVVLSTASGFRLIESIPISTRNCAISG